jgi:hypothetical protein
MTYSEIVNRIAELEAKYQEDETDWESFFQAAELWEEIMAQLWDGKSEEERYQIRRRVYMLVEGRKEVMKPGPWTRFWNKITKRTKR